MSYLITIEPTIGDVAIRNNCEEITPDKYNSVYKTKLDLSIRNSRNGASLPVISTRTNQEALHRDKTQVSEIISMEGSTMKVDSTNTATTATTVDTREEDSDVGVETRSCGKISALINHFKNVEATIRPEKITCPKVPAKKLRMDFQSSVSDNSSSLAKIMDTSSTNKDLETTDTVPFGNGSLSVVKLHFKMHSQETPQLQQIQIMENKMKQNSQLTERNIITTKPLVMPRSFKNKQTICILPQQAASQPMEICNMTPSDQVQLSPSNDASKSDHSSYGNKESKKVQKCVQQSPSGEDMAESPISNCDNTAVKNLQESDSFKTDRCLGDFITTLNADPCIDPEHQTVSGSTEHQTVSGSTEHQTVSGSTEHQTVSGSTEHQTVSGSTEHQTVSGSTEHQTVSGSTEHQTVSGSTEHQTVSGSTEHQTVSGSTVYVVDNKETSTETRTATSTTNDIHGDWVVLFPVKERQAEKDMGTDKSEVTPPNSNLIARNVEPTITAKYVKTIKQENLEKHDKCMTDEVVVTVPATSNTNYVCDSFFKNKIVTSNLVTSEHDSHCYLPKIQINFGNSDLMTTNNADTSSCDVTEKQISNNSGGNECQSPSIEYSAISDRINVKLDTLKSELMAMRKMDLLLLRQLINISQTMQRIKRADVLRVTRSLTFLNPNKTMPRRCKPVERQNSAPHCADRRRFLFSNLRPYTEDDYRDSLSSFDESEVESTTSEVEESTNSLNNILANSPRSAVGRRTFFQSRDLLVSLDVAEDAEDNYEDILRRNVRLWKMSFERHQSVQEEVDVWL